MEWLAALGGVDAADPSCVKLPEIPSPTLQRLLNTDPMYSKPTELDRQGPWL